MKQRIALILIAVFAVVSVASAQVKVNKRELQKATDEVTKLYRLSPEQQQQVREIQEWRLRNMTEIEAIRSSDYPAYLDKRRSVRMGAEQSIKRLLNESQLVIFEQQMAERRQRELDLMRSMKRQGVTPEKIQLALLEIE
ncbi:MAG TPA: hypothetical protein PKC76_14510 [Saprospiraceae bacterium]|nr:hypothetical protein [Saprospiraceae bacterium]HMP25344.1 hypothetical protein [Saprospiraceae bacterium]